MNKFLLKSAVSALAVSLSFGSAFAEETLSQEDILKLLNEQQAQIAKLQALVKANQAKVKANSEKADATADAIEHTAAVSSSASHSSTSVGGYAELHYNGGNKPTVDFHRYVLFIGHEFTDSIRFFSEFEIEHSIAGDGKVGEVELEQAYIEFDLNENHMISTGLMLVPVGIMNETHEPPTFYGVERNNVEKNIIPATWWEAGVKFSGKFDGGVSYDVMVSSGLDTISKPYNIRSGRRKVGKAPWESTAYTARLVWKPMAGVEVGGTFQYQSDIIQDRTVDLISNSATLLEFHTNIEQKVTENGTFAFRALYAQWNISGEEPELTGQDKQSGFYLEPSYKISFGDDRAVGIFARYSKWDNQAGDAAASAYRQTNFGINFWPTTHVVFKVDYQIDDFDNESKEDNRINLGLGVHF